ncbi:MAG: LysR family transcriptional regulator [bacterium]|nr:LysR family transcriptional regulator [bacterium]
MIANIEALMALSTTGTMTRAATRLRITQSAVSKRIAALENELGLKLVEPAGRRVRLTPQGIRLLEKTAPFMAAIKEALLDETPLQGSQIVIGVSESILSSWGPQLLIDVKQAMPRLELTVNAHRSPVAIDHVRSGEYMLALAPGVGDQSSDLVSRILLEETMVIVPSGLKPFALADQEKISVITIEPHAATWRWLDRRIKRFSKAWDFTIEVEQTLQSFSCIAQMARCGFGHGLVPAGVVEALGIPSSRIICFPEPGLTRPVSLVGRSTTFSRPLVKTFYNALVEAVSSIPANAKPGGHPPLHRPSSSVF